MDEPQIPKKKLHWPSIVVVSVAILIIGGGYSYYFWHLRTITSTLSEQNTNITINPYAVSQETPNTLVLETPNFADAYEAMQLAYPQVENGRVLSAHQCQNTNGEVLYKFQIRDCSYNTSWYYVNAQKQLLPAETVRASQAAITCTGDVQLAMRRALNLGYGQELGSIVEDTDTVYVATNQHQLVALHKENGSVKWKIDFNGPLGKKLVARDGFIFATIGGQITKVDAKSGTVLLTTGGTDWTVRYGGIVVQERPKRTFTRSADGKYTENPVDLTSRYTFSFENDSLHIQFTDKNGQVTKPLPTSLAIGIYDFEYNSNVTSLYWNGEHFVHIENSTSTGVATYDKNGKLLWRAPFKQTTYGVALPLLTQGEHLLYGGIPGTEHVEVRQEPSNTLLWQVDNVPTWDDSSSAALVDKDRYFFVEDLTEWLNDGNGRMIPKSPYNVSVRARNASDGKVIWTTQIHYPPTGFGGGICIE